MSFFRRSAIFSGKPAPEAVKPGQDSGKPGQDSGKPGQDSGKPGQDSGLSEHYLKVFQQYRSRLVKDIDPATILNYLQADEGFKADIKAQILSFPTKEARNDALLYRLETRGDKAFMLFLKALKEKYKFISRMLESSLQSLDVGGDPLEHVTVLGDEIRQVLRKHQQKKKSESAQVVSECVDDVDDIRRVLRQHQQRKKSEPVRVVKSKSQSVDNSDDQYSDNDTGDYLSCYTVPTRGKHLQEPWVTDNKEPFIENPDTEFSYMGCLVRPLVFREVTSEEIPEGVRRPLAKVKLYILEDSADSKMQYYDYPERYLSLRTPETQYLAPTHSMSTKFHQSSEPADRIPRVSNLDSPVPLLRKLEPSDLLRKALTITSLPPPPPLSQHPSANVSTERSVVSDEFDDADTDALQADAPPLPLRNPYAGPSSSLSKPLPPKSAEREETQGEEEQEEEVKDITEKPQREIVQTVVVEREVKEKPEKPLLEIVETVDVEKEVKQKPEKPLPEILETTNAVKEDRNPKEMLDEFLMNQEIPAPDDDSEEDGSEQAIVNSFVKNSNSYEYPLAAVSKDNLSNSKGSYHEILQNVSNSERSSIEITENVSNLKRSSSDITENDSGILNPPVEGELPVNGTAYSKTSTPASLQWRDVPVLSNPNESNYRESYYEEIDDSQHDSEKPHHDSNDYLHPLSSTGKLLEQRHTSESNSYRQTSTCRMVFNMYVELQKDDLLLVELEETVDEEVIKVVTVVSANSIPTLAASEVNSRCIENLPEHEVKELQETEKKAEEDLTEDNSITSAPLSGEVTPESLNLLNQPSSPQNENIPDHGMQEVEEDSTEDNIQPSPISVLKTVEVLEGGTQILPASPSSKPTFLVDEKKESKGIDKGTQFDEKPTTAVPSYICFLDTYLCYDELGRGFYIKKEFVLRFDDPSKEPWYYPIPLTSLQATLFLRAAGQVGCFLVYKTLASTPQRPYNLSVCYNHGDVLHYHIVQNARRDVMVEGHDHSFLSIKELVEYFKRNKSNLATRLRRPLKEACMPISPGYHYAIQYELKRKDLYLSSTILHRGDFGVVCCGSYKNYTNKVAIKILESGEGGEDHTQQEDAFVEEACTMARLKQHDHIVKFVGVCCSARQFFLVTEHIPNGSLWKNLKNGMIPNDHIAILFDICLQVTSAMYHLESCRYLLHRDVAARNFLVDTSSNFCTKLSNFSQARFVSDDNYQAEETEAIAIKWAAPEVISRSEYSTKSDVWSLGVLYWEILSGGQLPFPSMTNEEAAIFIIEGGNLEKPSGCCTELFRVMKRCWCKEPRQRPTFAILYHTLKSLSSIY